jgi:hypothetical protein
MYMNPDVKESEYTPTSTPGIELETETPTTKLPPPVSFSEESGTSPVLLPPTSGTSNEQWREIGERIYDFFASLPDYLSEFFGEYKRPIITVGLIFGSVVAVKLTLALLDAVNDIPLLAPTFELIGFGYTAWFIYRYLRTASGRGELTSKFNDLKAEVVGRDGKG